MKLPFCSICKTIHSKGEACASAPLTPLAPPAGITGTTLADLPDRRTVWEMRVDGSFLRWCGTLEQFRKDCEEYCDRSKGHWEKVTNTEFRFISPEDPNVTHFKAVKKGVDSVVESSATLPASPVKDTPDFSGLAPIFDKAELASMKAAASPVESVGVPAKLGNSEVEYMLLTLPQFKSMNAKIKALETALKDCVESLSRLPDTEGAYRVTCLESAKAALALPCA